MILSTTPTIEGRKIKEYKGIVVGETILGAHLFKDFLASLTDTFGGRSGAYERSLQEARTIATDEMTKRAQDLGANAIVGIDLDYETVGAQGSMLMVNVSGTAVVLE